MVPMAWNRDGGAWKSSGAADSSADVGQLLLSPLVFIVA